MLESTGGNGLSDRIKTLEASFASMSELLVKNAVLLGEVPSSAGTA